jgi:hypothetical protein
MKNSNILNDLLFQFRNIKNHKLSKKKPIICIDTEFLKNDSKKVKDFTILEVGFSIVKDNKQITTHYIVEENKDIYHDIETYDKKHDFLFKTKIMKFEDIKLEIKDILADDNYMFVGHGIKQDLDIFGIKTKFNKRFDTQNIHLYLQKYINNDGKSLSFKTLLEDFNVDFKEELLHNAGNDAFYFIKLLNKVIHAQPIKLKKENK